LYDVFYFENLLKILRNLEGKISVYIFSQSKEIFEDEIHNFGKKINIMNIPDDILETYIKIFNF